MMQSAVKEQPINGTAAESLPAGQLTPRQRQRLAEDAIAEIEAKYRVIIVGVVKTLNGGHQFVTWEVAPLPDKIEGQ